ncbi:MAG: hypothetical protein V9F04_01130 [Dermatophilaceae bacterium]
MRRAGGGWARRHAHHLRRHGRAGASWKSGGPGAPKVIKVARPVAPGRVLQRRPDARDRGCTCAAQSVLHLHAMWTTSNPQIAKAAEAASACRMS